MLLLFVLECGPFSGAGRTPDEVEHVSSAQSLCLHLLSLLSSVNTTLAKFPSSSEHALSFIPWTTPLSVPSSLLASYLLWSNSVQFHSSQIYSSSVELSLGIQSHSQESIWNFLKLECSWLTILVSFRCVGKVTWLYILYIHTHTYNYIPLKKVSILIYYKMLNLVPCAI